MVSRKRADHFYFEPNSGKTIKRSLRRTLQLSEHEMASKKLYFRRFSSILFFF